MSGLFSAKKNSLTYADRIRYSKTISKFWSTDESTENLYPLAIFNNDKNFIFYFVELSKILEIYLQNFLFIFCLSDYLQPYFIHNRFHVIKFIELCPSYNSIPFTFSVLTNMKMFSSKKYV